MSPLGRSLLAVNVVLLSALFIFQLESPARGGAVDPRPRGSYLMVTSTMEAGNSEVLYLIDDANREMVALRWDLLVLLMLLVLLLLCHLLRTCQLRPPV